MNVERVAPDHAYDVEISWTRPIAYESIIADGSPHDAEGWLYMILGHYRACDPTIFYVGKVFETCVSHRLRQPDHRRRYERLRKEYPHHTFQVSLGAVHVTNGRITAHRIDAIETILIYTVFNSQPRMINRRKWYKFRVPNPYAIRNLEYRKPLPKEIHLGAFIR